MPIKRKSALQECGLIIAIYIANFIVILWLLKPRHIFEPALNINMQEGRFELSGQGVFIPTFLILTSLIYFIKEALLRFKRQLQNYITIVSIFLTIATLFATGYMLNMLTFLFSGMEQMSKSLSMSPGIMQQAIGNVNIISKAPAIIIYVQLVLLIMLIICTLYTGKNLKRAPTQAVQDL